MCLCVLVDMKMKEEERMSLNNGNDGSNEK